ncbi:MAG: phytanoyl-CoA dioxygenase family protein [Candidatus Sericytochromatia bacterium]
MTRFDLPEYSGLDFDPGEVGQTLRTRGVVLLRALVPVAQIDEWLPAFEAGYAEYDAHFQAGLLDEQNVTGLYKWGHVLPSYIERFSDWLRATVDLPRLKALLHSYLGDEAFLLMNNCAPRRQGPVHPEHAIFFHQDQEFMGAMHKAVNIWVPMTPAGGDWPGLELWLDSPQAPLLSILMTPQQRSAFYERIPKEKIWRPVLSPGDVLIFPPYTVHRTWLEPAMAQTRISSEIRLISVADRHLTRSDLVHFDLSK